jgi:4-azaleucine resistance transporter AzlC
VGARAEFLAGARAELPLVLGVVPFGLIYGVLAGDAGIAPEAAVAMSAIIFAGSAQFIATQMLASEAPAVILLLTTFVVNLRHVLYSASLAPALRPLRPGWRWPLAYLLTDEAYAVVIRRFTGGTAHTAHRHWFFLGAGLTLWTSWLASSAVGVYVGTVVPSAWSLEFMLTLTFIAIVVPMLTDRPLVIAAAAASVVSVAAASLPMRLGLMAGAAAGITAGLVAERRRP